MDVSKYDRVLATILLIIQKIYIFKPAFSLNTMCGLLFVTYFGMLATSKTPESDFFPKILSFTKKLFYHKDNFQKICLICVLICLIYHR